MTVDEKARAKERILAIATALGGPNKPIEPEILPEFINKLKEALFQDPLLPRPNPTISLWQVPVHPQVAAIQSPKLGERTDFVVIGSGVTGCSVTKALLENASLKSSGSPHVTVLEARTLVSGATGRNGGHLVTPAGHVYTTLARRYGEENAKAMTRFSIMNVERILDLVKGLSPEIQQVSEIRDLVKVMVARDEKVWENARSSLKAFKAAVPEHNSLHRIVEQDDVPERWNVKDSFGAIEHHAGAVWPYRLLTAIFAQLLVDYPERLSIEANTPVTDVSYEASGTPYPYIVTTPRGVIRAKQVIHCTNAHAAHLLRPLIGKVYPFRGTMSVQKAGPSLPNLGKDRSWSSMEKFELDQKTGLYRGGLFYLQQNAITGDIWVGVECSKIFDTISGDDSTVSTEAIQALVDFLPSYFKDGWPEGIKPQIKGFWTGLQGHSSDGLPLVGKLSESVSGRSGNGEWIAGAYNGYGMDKAWMTGEALVRMIAGEGIPEWFPKCFLISEERFRKDLTTERLMSKWTSIAKTGDW